MFDGHWRTGIEQAVRPVGSGLYRVGLRADHLTGFGVVMAGFTAVAVGAGQLKLGVLLLALAGFGDLLDGAVAKAANGASTRGAYFDSVADRLSDALLFGGVAWYLLDTRAGHIALLPMAVLGAASLVSYQRAKADALGFDARGGVMERAERFIALGVGLFFSSILVPVLWLMLVLVGFTAGQRFVKVWRQAEPPPRRTPARRRSARQRKQTRLASVSQRRRARREPWKERSERWRQRARYRWND